MSSGDRQTWNAAQQKAIELDGNLLVSASAGTGKTAVLVERIIRRVLDPVSPVDVDRFLVVTFTDAAAAQMRGRILAAMLERRALEPGNRRLDEQIALLPRADISTLHSWCLRLIRGNFHRLGLDPALGVMDEHESELLLLEVLDRLCEDRYEREDRGWLDLVDAYGSDRGDEPVRQLALALLKFARTQPWPRHWLARSVADLDRDPGLSVLETPWVKEIGAVAAGQLALALAHLREAALVCEEPGGPLGYAATIAAEAGDLAAAAGEWQTVADGQPEDDPSEVDEQIWAQLLATLGRLAKQGRLPAVRGVPDEQRKRAQDLRNRAWAIVGRLQRDSAAWPVDDMRSGLSRAAPLARSLVNLVLDLDAAAREARLGAGRIDFPDFEHYALELLSDGGCQERTQPSGLAVTLQQHYHEVLVDEYQDINRAQEELLRLASRDNLFCVGDIKQSIYRFRGTDPGAFRGLRADYEAAGEGSAGGSSSGRLDVRAAKRVGRAVDLTDNYRSRPAVLDAVNFVFRQLMQRRLAELDYDDAAELRAGARSLYEQAPDRDAPVEVYLLERQSEPGGADAAENQDLLVVGGEREPTPDRPELDDLEREAALVGQRILEMVGDEGGASRAGGEFSVYDSRTRVHRPVRFGDIAVLMRAVQGRANRYLEILSRLGIPVRVELATGYFSAVEVETMLALMRVIDNPRQDIELAAVLRSPLVGLDERQLVTIRMVRRRAGFYDAVRAASEAEDDLGHNLRSFLHRLDEWRTAARRGPLGDLVWQLLHQTGYLAFVAGLPDGTHRRANLLALHERAREFDRFARQGLSRFLRFIERLHEAERDLGAVHDLGQELDAVLVTSVHKAKGLEFPVVILPDLGKRFHPPDRGNLLWHADLGLGPKVADRDLGAKYPTVAWQAIDGRLRAEGLAEELRVLYVALTRARERLVLSGASRDVGESLRRWRSTAGLAELPPEVLAAQNCYLDWLGMTLVRHRQACQQLGLAERAPTQDNEGDDEPDATEPVGGDEAAAGAPPHWRDRSRWLISGEGVLGSFGDLSARGGEARRQQAAQMWSRLQRLIRLGSGRREISAELDRRMSWQYPRPALARTPAKVSVTELRRLWVDTAAATDETATLWPAAAGQEPGARLAIGAGDAEAAGAARPVAAWDLPRLRGWGERRVAGALERGSLVHLVLQHLDLTRPLDRAGLATQLAGLKARRILPDAVVEEEPYLLTSLEWFFATPLGSSMARRHHQVFREVPFTMAVAAQQVWGARPELAGEDVLVQGIIDCVVIEPDCLEIVEFKTDRLAPGMAAATATGRYQLQVDLYALAARAAYRRPVRRAHLVLLTPQVIATLSDPGPAAH